jgi:Na+-transporting methylmalonyl-CoA/oxaloacetate decarboxylase gamma subunit
MKMIVRKIAFAVVLIMVGTFTSAQSAKDFQFNEILVNNTLNYEDNYGERGAWIEVFNSAYNKVNIGGCFLTDDLKNPTKYRIPKNDPNTFIPGRYFVVFWADGKTTHGTFHLNFKLDSTSRFIALFDADGKSLIDSVSIPHLKANYSFGRVVDGGSKWMVLEKTTPMATNITLETVSAGQKFAASDPSGIGMTLVAMTVVFAALILLYLFFRQFGKFNIHKQKKKVEQHASIEGKTLIHEEISGEVFAAISAALYLYETEQHDFESTVLTINRAAKIYSPWSSKIYGLRHIPQKESAGSKNKR